MSKLTLEERVEYIEELLGITSIDSRYVAVTLDQRSKNTPVGLGVFGRVQLYTYEDCAEPPLRLGDRVSAPVGKWGNRVQATVVAVDVTPPSGISIKPLHQRLYEGRGFFDLV